MKKTKEEKEQKKVEVREVDEFDDNLDVVRAFFNVQDKEKKEEYSSDIVMFRATDKEADYIIKQDELGIECLEIFKDATYGVRDETKALEILKEGKQTHAFIMNKVKMLPLVKRNNPNNHMINIAMKYIQGESGEEDKGFINSLLGMLGKKDKKEEMDENEII